MDTLPTDINWDHKEIIAHAAEVGAAQFATEVSAATRIATLHRISHHRNGTCWDGPCFGYAASVMLEAIRNGWDAATWMEREARA